MTDTTSISPLAESRTQQRKTAGAEAKRRYHLSREMRKKWLTDHADVATQLTGPRPWGERDQEAERGAPWWGVKRLGPHGNLNHRRMFRHATEESAKREAQFLAETWPGAVFAVLASVSVHVVGEPEVSLTSGHKT